MGETKSKRLCLLFFLAFLREGCCTPLGDKIVAAVQPVLDQYASAYNTSFSLGFSDATTRVGVSSGIDDHGSGKQLNPTSLIPMGSVTKSWTGAAVMQFVEKGAFGLDDPVCPLVDKIMKAETAESKADEERKDEDAGLTLEVRCAQFAILIRLYE